MDYGQLRLRLADASVAVLSTVNTDGSPHSVPICFALDGDFIYFAIDHKPKRTRDLRRLQNIASNPSVAVLVHHYEHDWARLWWVRADGTATVLGDGEESQRAVAPSILRSDHVPGMKAQPAFCARISAKIPEGTTIAPGIRFARASASTSAVLRLVRRAAPADQLPSAMLHTRLMRPR